jgi:HPt (histidine-containing phosphotransfer) domain-containing protein
VSAIDPTVTGQLAEILPRDEFLRLLETFDEDLGRLADQYCKAVAADDAEAGRVAAHGLAGAAAGIGAKRLEAAARQALRPDAPETPQTLAFRIGQEAGAARAALAAMAQPPTPA